MRLLPLIVLAALLTGCASDAPAEMETSQVEVEGTQQATESDSGSSDATTDATEESEPEQAEQPATTEDADQTQQSQSSNESDSGSTEEVAEETTPEPAPAPAPAPEPEPEPEPEATEPSGYTMADVSANDSTASCWAAIDGKVYNLTDWISQHPGGSGAISSLCGTDATRAFESRHGSQPNPNAALDRYLLGPLAR